LGPFIFNKREAWEEADKILRDQLMLKQSFHWSPYDPEHFISYRRVKNKLTGCVHHKIPQIQQYANQQEWVEGTLVKEITEEERLEKEMKELEKTIDLHSFGQVPSNCLNTLERAHHLLQLHNNLPKKALHQQGHPKARKCCIQSRKQWQISQMHQRGKALQHKQRYLKSLCYKLLSMRKEPRKETGKKTHL